MSTTKINFPRCPRTPRVTWIRAVAGQRSSPELCLANKTKMHLKQQQKNELKIARVLGCSIFSPLAPPHGKYSGVSSYGMEADLPRFLYLKDEYFLITNWCDIDISLIMKNSKSVTLTSRSVRRWGWVGNEQRKILDQYVTSGIVSTRSIQRFKRYPILKTFNQKLQCKISKTVTLTSKFSDGGDGVALNFRSVPNIRQSINMIQLKLQKI